MLERSPRLLAVCPEIINLGIQSPRGFRQVAPEFIGCIAALTMFDGGPAINRVHLAFDETFQRVQPLLRLRPDFAQLPGPDALPDAEKRSS
jgi:hypothetical protein